MLQIDEDAITDKGGVGVCRDRLRPNSSVYQTVHVSYNVSSIESSLTPKILIEIIIKYASLRT